MRLEKILKLTIMDALDTVWSESGMTPSKRTREAIVEASKQISAEVEEDFTRAYHNGELDQRSWEQIATIRYADMLRLLRSSAIVNTALEAEALSDSREALNPVSNSE